MPISGATHTAVSPSASRAFGARISAVSRKLNALGGKPAAAAAPTKQPPALSSDVAVIDWSAGAVAATTCVRAKTAHMPATRRSVGSSSAAEVHEICSAEPRFSGDGKQREQADEARQPDQAAEAAGAREEGGDRESDGDL